MGNRGVVIGSVGFVFWSLILMVRWGRRRVGGRVGHMSRGECGHGRAAEGVVRAVAGEGHDLARVLLTIGTIMMDQGNAKARRRARQCCCADSR